VSICIAVLKQTITFHSSSLFVGELSQEYPHCILMKNKVKQQSLLFESVVATVSIAPVPGIKMKLWSPNVK